MRYVSHHYLSRWEGKLYFKGSIRKRYSPETLIMERSKTQENWTSSHSLNLTIRFFRSLIGYLNMGPSAQSSWTSRPRVQIFRSNMASQRTIRSCEDIRGCQAYAMSRFYGSLKKD